MSNNSTSSNDNSNNYHVCRICSDRAIGYNFSVLTCEPCKAFFRRTADKLEELQCPFNNDCDIDRVTRKICRRCRLVKCLKVGMRKDWAQNDDDKKSRYSSCSNLVSRGCGGGGKSPTSSDYSSISSNGSCKGGKLFGFINDDLLRDKCKKSTSRSYNQDVDCISSASSSVAKNWSTSSLPSPPSSISSLASMSPTKTRASFNQHSVTTQSSKLTSLSSSCFSSSTSSLPSTLSSSSSCSSSKQQQQQQRFSYRSSSLSSSSSSSSSHLNHSGPSQHNSGLTSVPRSSSSSSSSLSSSSIMPTIDLMNSLQQSCRTQSNYQRQTREDIQRILQSTNNSDWLIRFLVESHALNLPTSKPMLPSTIPEFNFRANQQQSTIRSTDIVNCSRNPQSSSNSESNPCTRVGVIVDGRKLVPSNSPPPPSTLSASKSCGYPLASCSELRQLPPPPPPLLTTINTQIDYNLKARVIRKILDANFAPSHLKQGSRKGVALDDLESGTIDNLVNAFDFFNQPLTVNNCELTSIEGVTQFTDLYLEKLISGCRFLSSYAKLCLEDQITLVKGGFPDILAIKSHLCASLSTSTTTNVTSTVTTTSTTSTASSSRASDNCWQSTTNQHSDQTSDHPMRQIQDSFRNTSDHGNVINTNWISDPKVICILIAIVLFNPELPNLQAIDTIKLEQYTYIYLLKRYLESQCGSSCRARSEHFNLIYSIEKIMITRSERTSYPPRMTIDHSSSIG